MRFEQLRLDRFGHFADKVIDLRGEEIQLIHGPTASGKSTIRAATSELLFGIDERTTYDFRFEKNQLRLGATIATRDGARRLEFVRYKRRTRSLARPDGSDLDDDALMPFLGGMDRRTFVDLYVLDQETLRAGGEHMLSAEGDVGRSLFAASSGFADLAETREALKRELEGIALVNRKMKTSRLWQLEAEYNEARARQKAASLRKSEWTEAKTALAEAEARITTLSEDRRRIERERSKLDRKLRVLLVLPRLDRHRAAADALAGAPDLPENFAESWRKAESILQSALDAEASAAEEEKRLYDERQTLPQDAGPLVTVAAAVEDLHQRVANIADQQQAKTKLGRDVLQHTERLRELVVELGGTRDRNVEETLATIPTRSTCARIEALIADRGKIDAAIEAARRRRGRAQVTLEAEQASLEKLGEPRDPSDAERQWKAAVGFGNVRRAIASAVGKVQEANAAEDAALARLAPWTGTVEELERTPLQSHETVTSIGATLRQIAEEERSADVDLNTANAALREIEDDLKLVTAASEIPTVDVIHTARQARDASWEEVKKAASTGRRVEEGELAEHGRLVIRADELVDLHVQHHELPTVLRNRTRAQRRIEQCTADLQRAHERKARELARWRKLWDGTGWDPASVGEPDVMKTWLDRVKETEIAANARRTAERVLTEAKEDERQARDAGLRAAALVGVTLDLELSVDQLREEVGKAVAAARTAWEEARGLDKSIASHEAELKEATTELAERTADLEAWGTRWAESMPPIRQEVTADPAAVRGILALWATIREEHTKRLTAQHRLDGVIEDLEEHESVVRAFVEKLDRRFAVEQRLGEDWSKSPAILFDALKMARDLAGNIEAANKALSAAQRAHARAADALASAKAVCDQLRTEEGLAANADMSALIDRSDRKREIRQRLVEAEQELFQAADGLPEAELRSEIAEANVDTVRANIAALAEKTVMLDEPVRQASADRLKAEQHLRMLEARTGFTTAAMEANAAAAEVKALAQRWLRLRAAQILLDRAVERYRKANEGPLLQRADEIFGAIVRDRLPDDFTGLEVDYEDPEKPTIIARRRDGSSCVVKRMSTGTRDQLWLSLRIAALERRARDVEPMPFLGDDLFDSSDEASTMAMLTAVAELARHTQVLLFTHHSHVVDIAADALGKRLRVHRLEPAATEVVENA